MGCGPEPDDRWHAIVVVALVALVALGVGCGGGGDPLPPIDAAPCVDLTHDEDGDGIGDRCDNCPAVANASQLDSSERALGRFEDGVGDACDPRGALSGDVLAQFFPFASEAEAEAWSGGGWTIAGDAAHASDDAHWVIRKREQASGLYLQLAVARVGWRAGGAIELTLDSNAEGEAGLRCTVHADRDGDGNDELEASEVGVGAVTESLGAPIDDAVVITAWRLIDPQQRGHLICRVTLGEVVREARLETADGLTTGIYGMGSRGATTQVSSVVVYTSPLISKLPL